MFHFRKVFHISSYGDATVFVRVVIKGISQLSFTTKFIHCFLDFSQAAANTFVYVPNAFKLTGAVLSVLVLYSDIAVGITSL